ncbi:hypothetical protein GCM10009007_02960 [Formosimonas limnophila]|uniref:YqaJ viral recombinase domain-containing protein n=1 Tax=Formosimonas limnophila TaxID=1384487 RepID=A0A8J3CLX5_9BURK|nr:YqaJ viral recombinase family protein [Formosimonas limnophila]GHA65936.1 hypothetical protein GCM10009007_02960 [Formosimonas limnophila]
MQTINLIQGSPEWHAHRRSHFNASDAPAMMGVSPYKTRAQLIKEYATGLTEEVDAQTQRIYDKGHRFEELARVAIAEPLIGEDLFPCVGVDGKFSASFDGLTMLNDVDFEHKTLNAKIEAYKTADDIDIIYRIQMEQQLMVSGAEKCLFVASKWTDDDELIDKRDFWYKPDFELRQRIIDGWAQFEKDVADYAHEAVDLQPVGATMETLPALNVQVTGTVTASNIESFKTHALAVIGSVNKDLETDQDFADAEKAIKWCGDVEDRLKSTKEHALSQTASIDELFTAIDYISETARQTRLQLEKIVKARKESIRTELVTMRQNELNNHIKALNADLSVVSLPTITADFAGVIKGKKTIESIDNALETELANAKIKADGAAREIRANLKTLDEVGAEHKFLFNDLQSIITKPADDFANVVKMRVSEHQQAEKKRLDAERERIRSEEQAKAEREAKAVIEAERAQAEAQAKLSEQQARATQAEQVQQPAQTIAPLSPAHAASNSEYMGEATLTIGLINERLGFVVNAEFLAQLGFEPEQVGKFKKYHEADFESICNAIIHHISAVTLTLDAA